jgi:hypothetical protein
MATLDEAGRLEYLELFFAAHFLGAERSRRILVLRDRYRRAVAFRFSLRTALKLHDR